MKKPVPVGYKMSPTEMNYEREQICKFILALRGDPSEIHFTSYIIEKLERILKKDVVWHALVNEAFEEQKDTFT
jgi:hypothetical protein